MQPNVSAGAALGSGKRQPHQAGGRGQTVTNAAKRWLKEPIFRCFCVNIDLMLFTGDTTSASTRCLVFAPRVEGGERTAELRLCAGYPSGTAQARPAGDAGVRKQWAGRCVATGRGIARW